MDKRTIKCARRTKGPVDQLDDQIIAMVVEDHPQSAVISGGTDIVSCFHDGRDVVIFYIGDYHLARVLIDVRWKENSAPHLSTDIILHFERIGITEEQIASSYLPTKPRKEGDRRSARIRSTVKAEAVPAAIMRHLLRSGIEAPLPPDALAIAKAAEESERTMIDGLAGMQEAR